MKTDSEWTTAKADAQRSASIQFDNSISVQSLGKPDFTLLWKLKLDIQRAGLNSMSEAVMVNASNGPLGHKSIALVGGTNSLFAIDYDLGVLHWDKHFDVPPGTLSCAAGITLAPGRSTPLMPAPPRGVGLTPPYRSAVGNPGEGVPKEIAVGQSFPTALPGSPAARPPTASPALVPAPSASGGEAAAAAMQRPSQAVYTIASDGMLHAYGHGSSKEVEKPRQFAPAGTSMSDLIQIDSVVYGATLHGCGVAEDSVYAVNTSQADVSPASWKSASGAVLGAPAFTHSGEVIVSTVNAVVMLSPVTLKEKGTFTASGVTFVSTPVVFGTLGHDYVAVGAGDGRILVIDAQTMKTSAASNAEANFIPSALAVSGDSSGAHWIFASDERKERSSVHAFRLNSVSPLKLAWTSTAIVSPGAPILVNGVLFALSTGEFRGSGDLAEDIKRAGTAVLYAMDASTGKELWNSGRTITSFVHSAALSASPGQVYVGTYDDTLYAFGFMVPRQ